MKTTCKPIIFIPQRCQNIYYRMKNYLKKKRKKTGSNNTTLNVHKLFDVTDYLCATILALCVL